MKKLDRHLIELSTKFTSKSVEVGFLEGGKYPTGMSIPLVAWINEYGRPDHNQPPRPFFRQMIVKESNSWQGKIKRLLMKYDSLKTLKMMGEDIKGAIVESINELLVPPLSPITIKKKGFSKPLIETGIMKKTVDFKVIED